MNTKLTNKERDALASAEQKSIAYALAIDAYDKEGTYFDELSRLGVPTELKYEN